MVKSWGGLVLLFICGESRTYSPGPVAVHVSWGPTLGFSDSPPLHGIFSSSKSKQRAQAAGIAASPFDWSARRRGRLTGSPIGSCCLAE